MSIYSHTSIPSWLETPPLSQVNPPIETRLQELPFGELSWEDFERLCLRLARLEANVEHCQLYGESGQKQEGIDIYARHRFAEKYRVYQCKRVKDFGPAKINDAVSKFLVGEWINKTDTFVLCTKESLRSTERINELEAQKALLKGKGVTLLPWDCNELSIKLKDVPKLVDDFFGRAWVTVFCGQEGANKLGKRLDVKGVGEFRKKLMIFYRHVFNTHDPGIPITTLDKANLLPLEDRYVLPDVYDSRSISISIPEETTKLEVCEDDFKTKSSEATTVESSRKTIKSQRQSFAYQQRQSVENWLAASHRNIILGGPGSGKSSLLRFMAIDILQESPRLTVLSQKWGKFLPVWIPFALWTKMISNPFTFASSVSELIHSWLKSWNEERLWPIVELALEDERLLLLVDGLDEWTDESAARIALDRLKVFIEQRNIPVIVTSRPHGFEHLGMQYTDWQLGELGDFSPVQQEQLSRIWFSFKTRNLYSDSACDEQEIERMVHTETMGFLNELHKSPDIRELAKVPLLLCLLIYHRFHNTRLPQSRFKAYDSLIEHLISIHPKRRRTASFLTDVSPELTDDEVKRIFAHLAYYMQGHCSEGVIEHNKAITVIETYLKNSDYGFGFEQRESLQHSREIMEIGENMVGLLVKRSPKEVGFFHRVFQEYLAAYYLSRIPLSEQSSIVEIHCTDPQWHETILGLFYITSRAEDIKQFIYCIKTKLNSVNIINRYAIELLLCETAVGDFNCPVNLARELAEDAFKQIELGSWMPQRERLLQHVLDGLRSTKVKELVKSKLMSWFPCRERWRNGIFSTMANWPFVPEVIECLWKGIHDEEPINQRAAARALADLAKGDLETGNRIISLARNSIDPKVRATAIACLLRGWSNHENIESILKDARYSINPELRLVAIQGKIKNHVQTEEDWKELVRLGSWDADLDYHWRDDVALALMCGWPKSSKTKEACFSALKEGIQHQQKLDIKLALRILLEGYPQDIDVVQFCVDEIKYQRYPFNILHFDAWQLIAQNFKDCPQIIAAIDEWIPKQEHREPYISMAAMVGRTPIAKSKLLSSFNTSVPHWLANALIDGWGMKDSEVNTVLTQIAFSTADKASRIGHLLPKIIEDKVICRKRLIALLQDSKCTRLDFVMNGLKNMGNTQDDSEVVDIVLNTVLNRLNRKSQDYQDVVASLIVGYSFDMRVKELAKRELSERNSSYIAIALAYGDDEEIRKRIIEMVCPLPVRLRTIIAIYLGEVGVDETFTMSLLKLYDHEQDGEVKTQASISYHERLKTSEQDRRPVIESLSESIVCYGFDHEERRQAAFCGLVILDRLDVMVSAKERIDNDRLCGISIDSGLSLNVPLLRYTLQNWDIIKASLGNEFWQRLSRDSDLAQLWNVFCMFADKYPSPREEAVRFLETRKERIATPNILRFLGKVRPKSKLLLEYCLKTLRIEEDQQDCSGEEAVIAAELLGMHFGNDNDVLLHIMSEGAKKHIYNKVILALCEGWPESNEIEHIFEVVSKQKLQLSLTAYFRLICQKSQSKVVFDGLEKILSSPNPAQLYNSRFVTRPILRRLRTDDNLFEMLIVCLQNKPTPSEKATIPRLISAARGIPNELRTWCNEEMNRQLDFSKIPQVGVDLIVGEVRPVVHSLLDIFNQLGLYNYKDFLR